MACAFLTLGCTLNAAQAQQVVSVNTDTETADVFVMVWDPINLASYVKVLGVTMNDFLWQGQQDAGVQRFWTLDVANDINFQRLRNLGGSPSTLRWAVMSFDAEGFLIEDFRAMTTLRPTATPGVQGNDYVNLRSLTAAALQTAVGSFAVPFAQGNQVQDTGSSFRVVGQDGYFAPQFEDFNASTITITNPVGSSSWFYYLSVPEGPFGPGTYGLGDPIVVDEFDNLSFDGYWGLAENPSDNTFLLSYTLPQAATALNLRVREFAASIGRTESTGGFAVRRLEGGVGSVLELPAGGNLLRLGEAGVDITNSLSPVPEPGTWTLMLMGLTGMTLLARRRPAPPLAKIDRLT